MTEIAPIIIKATVSTLQISIEIEGRSYEQQGTLTITVLDASNPPVGEWLEEPKRVLCPEKAYQDLDDFMADTPAFFQWLQRSSLPMNEHYTGKGAIGRIQTISELVEFFRLPYPLRPLGIYLLWLALE